MQQEYTGLSTTPLYSPSTGKTVAETKELHNKAAVSLRGARSQTSTLGLYSLYFNFFTQN